MDIGGRGKLRLRTTLFYCNLQPNLVILQNHKGPSYHGVFLRSAQLENMIVFYGTTTVWLSRE